jgi:hydrogenase maturation protease
MNTAVIGVGNEYRRDDGIGPAVVARLAQHDLPGVTFTVCDGEPSQLIDAWANADLAVVIDAVLCERPKPGRVHRTSLGPLPTGARSASTHGLGIPEAIRLADALDQAPRRLVVYAVEAADLGFGVGLSPPVAAAAHRVERAVLIVAGCG